MPEETSHLAIEYVHHWYSHDYRGMTHGYSCDLADGMCATDDIALADYHNGSSLWLCDECARRLQLIW